MHGARAFDVHAHPDRFFLAAKLSENRQGPRPNENFPFIVDYGYHFDANLVGKFLQRESWGTGREAHRGKGS